MGLTSREIRVYNEDHIDRRVCGGKMSLAITCIIKRLHSCFLLNLRKLMVYDAVVLATCGVARQIADRLQRVTCDLSNLAHNYDCSD